jgi:glycosyltransferase involved in cell wall biosynthesis
VKIGIACYPTFGGSGVVATELGHELAIRGHDVHFISYALPSRLNLFAERVSYHEVTVPTYPLFNYPPYDLALATRIVDVALHEGLDLIHAHYALPHAISAHLARRCSCRGASPSSRRSTGPT